MYIPTQAERYAKTATVTLLLCIIIPSGVVAWLADMGDVLTCASAFLQPAALLFDSMGFNAEAALCFSATVQAILFWRLVSTKKKLTPKHKLTIAVTWGMLTALLLRLLIAFTLWRQVTGR